MVENVVFIRGEQIDLLVKDIKHIKIYHKWVNYPAVRKLALLKKGTRKIWTLSMGSGSI